MSKVKQIQILNCKALSALTVDFNGCTAIVVGGNNKGKSSLLRSLPDRLRGIKPDAILKEGETNGFAEWTLTTGEKLRWEFKEGDKEKLIYITEKDIKTSLTQALRDKFFPAIFDVDKFLASAPKQQNKMLQELAGVNFDDVDKRYKEAYDDRENKNRDAKNAAIAFNSKPVAQAVTRINLDDLMLRKAAIRNKLNELYKSNKKANEDAKAKYEIELNEYNGSVRVWEQNQLDNQRIINECQELNKSLRNHGYTGNEVLEFIKTLPAPESQHRYVKPIEPAYPDPMPSDTELQQIDAEIMQVTETNRNADLYDAWAKEKQQVSDLQTKANDADAKVQSIIKERNELIRTAKMPEGFSFSDDGILYNGLAFTREQQSSSSLYIAALKLASLKIGEVRCLHFDASFLDKDNLMKIEEWAHKQDLQLLIERPSFEPEDIHYEIIESHE